VKKVKHDLKFYTLRTLELCCFAETIWSVIHVFYDCCRLFFPKGIFSRQLLEKLIRPKMNVPIADKVSFSVLKDHDSLSQVLDVINSAYKVSESFFRNADHIDRISREGKLIS